MNRRGRKPWATPLAYLGIMIGTMARSGSAQEPKPNSATEPLVPRASVARAAAFLDEVAASWTRTPRSVNNDKHHYITHAGTAYAVLALQACGVADEDHPDRTARSVGSD